MITELKAAEDADETTPVKAVTHYVCASGDAYGSCHGHTTRGGAEECNDRAQQDRKRNRDYHLSMAEAMKSAGDALVAFGSEVKAVGSGKVEGFLVSFGSAKEADISAYRDFFTATADYDLQPDAKSAIYYHHGMDGELKTRILGRGSLELRDAGIWIEGQLELRDAYEKAVYKMAEDGKLGWSSGTAAHLVERVREGKAHRITRWPLGLDASLTPTPADPRSVAVAPLKSLFPNAFAGEASSPTLGELLDELTVKAERLLPQLASQVAGRTAAGRSVNSQRREAFKSLSDAFGSLFAAAASPDLVSESRALQQFALEAQSRLFLPYA